MTNTDPSEQPVPAADKMAEGDGKVLQEGICGRCGYLLKGLPRCGTCPECGAAYTPETLSPLMSAPGALEIVVRYFWPALLLFGLGIFAAGASNGLNTIDGLTRMLFAIPVLVLVFPGNSMLQTWLMSRRYIQPAHRSKLAGRNVSVLGVATKAAFYTTAIVPPLIFGGCVVLVCGGGL